MRKLNRRDFVRQSLGALAVATCLPSLRSAATPALTATMVRPLGKTGLSCSLLGIGTGTRGHDGGTDQTRMPREELVNLLQYVHEKGITYFDLADSYKSHSHMKEAMAKSIPRDKVMLLTKVWERDPEKIRADIERFRKELDTDVLDVVLMHCLRRGEEDWPNTLKASMDALADAKARKIIRAHGVSCHTLPSLQRVADCEWADVVLARINPFGVCMDGPVAEVVPTLRKIHDAGKGVLAMKVLGEGDPAVTAKMAESIKFVLDLGSVDAMTIGFMNPKQVDGVMACIETVGKA